MPLFDFGANPLFETAQAGRLAKYAASGSGYKPAAPTEPEQADAPVDSGDPGVLRKIGSTAISGVGATGNLLDLPGSSVRDLISGRNPFDQWLDPFGRNADKNRVEGRQLLRESGMIGKKNTWGNFAGGLALEMVLDPTTYLGIPAASKIGKAFEVAGLGNKQLKAVVKEIAEDTGAKGFKSGRSWGMNTTGKRILDHMAKSRDTIASAVAKERKMKLIKEPFSSLDSLPKTADENALALLDEGGAYSLYKYSPNKKDGAGWIVDDDATELFRGKMGTRALGDKTYNGVKSVTEGYYKQKYKDGYDEALMSQPLTSFVSFKAPFMESTRKDLWYDKTPDISFEKRMGKQGVDLDGTMGGATPPPPKPPRSPKPKGGPDAQGAGPAGTPPTTPPGGAPNLPQVPAGAATSAAGKVGLQLSEDIKRQLKEAQLSDEDIADFETMDDVNDFLNPDAGNGIPVGDFPKEGDTLPPTTGTAPTPQTPPPGPAGGGGTPGASVNAPDLNVTSAAAEQVSDVTKPSTGVKRGAEAPGGDVAKDAAKVPTFEEVATTLKVVDGTARGKRIKELFDARASSEIEGVDPVNELVNIVPVMDAAIKTMAEGRGITADDMWGKLRFTNAPDETALKELLPGSSVGDAVEDLDSMGVMLLHDSKNVINLFKMADAATVIHEFAHFSRKYLPENIQAKANKGVESLLKKGQSLWKVDDQGKVVEGVWSVEAEEAFARAFERFVTNPKDINARTGLKAVFAEIRKMMLAVYESLGGVGLDINTELKKAFKDLLGDSPVPKAKKAAVDAQGVAAAAGGALDNVAGDAAKAVDNVAPVDDVAKTVVEDLPPDVNATSSVDDVTNTADDVVDDVTKTEVVDETQKVETPPLSAAETLVNKSKAVRDDATTNQAGKPVSDDPMRAAVDILDDGDAIKELIYKALQTPNTASLKALGITGRAATDVLRLLDQPLKDKTAESLAEAAEIISLRHTLTDATPAVRDVKPKGLVGDSVSPIEDVAKTADNVADDVTKTADETVDDVTKVETTTPSAAEELVNKSKAVSDDAATAENALIKEGTQAAGELAEQTPDNPLITIANKELDDAVDMHVSAAAAELIDDLKNGRIEPPSKSDKALLSVADKIIRRIHEEVPNLDVNNVDNTHIINRIKGTQEGIAQQVRNAAQDARKAAARAKKNAKERAKRAEEKAAAGKEADVKEAPEVLSDAQIQENRKLGEAKWNENEDAIVSAAMRAARSASSTATNHHDNILSKIMKEAYDAILKDPEKFDIKRVGGWMYKRATQRMLSGLAENAKKIRSSEGEIVGGLSRNYQSTPLSTSMHLDELMQSAGIVDEADVKAVRSMFLESKATKEAAADAGMTVKNAGTLRRKFSSYIRKQYSGMQESDVDGVLINSAEARVKSATPMQRQAIDEVADSVTNDFIKHDMYKQAYEQKKSDLGRVSIKDQLALKKEMDTASTSTPKAFMIRSVLKRILQNFTEKEAILDVVKKSEDNVIRQEFERLFPGEKMPDKVDEISEYMNQFRTFTNENSAVKAKVDDTIHGLFQRRNKKAAKKINDEGKDFVSKINSGAKQQPNTTQAARAAVNSIDDYELKLQMMDAMDGGEHLFFSNPIIRRAATLFDRTVLGGHTEQGQELARKQTEAWTRATFVFRRQLTGLVRAIGKTKLFSEHEIMKEYVELGADAAREKAREILNQRHNEFLRYMERDTHTLNTDLFKNTADRELLSGQLDLLKDVMPQELRRDALAGMETPDVNDEFINYWARYWYKGHTKTAKKARGEKVVEVGAEHHKARAKHTKNLPGGTATLNEISLDRNISGKYWEQDTLGIGFKDLIDNNGKKMKAYDYIREKYGVNIFGDNDFKMKDGARVVDKAGKEVLNATGRRKLKGITEMALHMPPVHAQKQIPMYGNNFIHDFAKRVEEGYARRGVALAAQEMAARNAGKGKQIGIEQFMKDIKTDNAQAFKNVISGSGNMDEYMKFLDKKIASLDKVLANKGVKTKDGLLKEIDGKIYRVTDEGEELIAGDKVDVLENILNIPKEFAGDEKGIKLTVDHEVYEEAMRFLKPWSRPQEVGDFMKIMQSTLNWFKTHVTIPFPSFHGRNFISGQIMNYFYDAYDPTAFGPNRYAKPIKQAFMLRGGHVVKGLYSEMPEWVQKDIKRQYNTISNVDEAASRWVQDNVFTYGLTGDKQGYAAERIGDSASSTITQMPGASPPNGFLGLLNRAAPGTRWFDRVNPFHIRGGGKPVLVPKVPSAAGGLAAKANPTDQKRWKTVYDKVFGEREWDKYDETAFMPVAIGEDMAVLTEDVNRIAPFMAFVKQGMDPAVAARKVQNIHFDYSDLSEFEKGLRNVFPFMTFTRKVIPLTFHDLATNPGGKQAWAIRASTRAQDPDLSAPDNVLRSTAIPLGQTESGADQYITGLGLPYEDALSFTGFLQGDWQGTVGELVSRMRPEIQGAAELATGQSTFFGKPLSDLDPPVGRLAQNLYETATGDKTEGQAAPIAGSRGVEFLLGKLPTSRYINTANNMLDQRDSIGEKAMAGLTGIKVQNVEPWMKERTSLTRATDVLREYGGRTLEMPYMPEWAKNRLSEGDRQDVEALQAFMRDVQKTGRQRKKDAEALAASLENAED